MSQALVPLWIVPVTTSLSLFGAKCRARVRQQGTFSGRKAAALSGFVGFDPEASSDDFATP